MAVNDYGFENWTCSLNGQKLEGLANSADAITFPSTDDANFGDSADGQVIASATGMRGGAVTIKCTAGLQADRHLSDLRTQFKNGDLEMPLRLLCVHNRTKETVECTDGTFQTSPTAINIGTGPPADMEYTIYFANVTRTGGRAT